MTRVDLHPEELFDRARRGVASEGELARFQAHLAHCATCRFEFDLAKDADWDVRPRDEDALRALRIKKRTLEAHRAAPAPSRSVQRSRARAGVVLALAVAFTGAAAAAALAVRAIKTPSAASAPPAHTAPRLAVAPPRISPMSVEPAAAPSAATRSAPPTPIQHAAPTKPEPVTEPVAGTAAALFSEANQARRNGDARRAAHLYQELERRFGGSPEEVVSRVTLGRLLLDRLGDAAGALAHFNAYLASPAPGDLQQEAMIGRALALGRLGRTNEEAAAWRALLAAYPRSTYADRARARLQALP